MKIFYRLSMSMLVLSLLLVFNTESQAQQWNGATNSTGSIYRSGNVSVGQNVAGIAKLDVRGDNIYLAPDGTTGFQSKFVGLGESGGDCPIYGYRAQRTDENFINVGLKAQSGPIFNLNDYLFGPTIAWGDSGNGLAPCTDFPCQLQFQKRARTLAFDFDGNDAGCGSLVARMYAPGETFQFEVFGDVRVNGTITSSDANLKKNVAPVANAMDKIKLLNGVTYDFKVEEFPEKNLPKTENIGFIAQEVKEVLPQAVKQGDDGLYGVNYTMVIPVLVEAVKEQNDVVQAQQATIEAMQKELDALKALVMQNTGKSSQAGTGSIGVNENFLFQNSPNPFNQATNIQFYIPENTRNANLTITDLSGKVLRTIPISERGNGEVVIEGGSLEAGIYLYSLTLDGERIATKQMVLSK